MKDILILGAAGGVGRQLVDTALAEGWRVVAMLRTPAKLPLQHPMLSFVKGNILEPEAYEAHISEHTAVVSSIGVSGGIIDRKIPFFHQ